MKNKDITPILESSLARLLAWVSSADGKVPTIFAIDSAMLGVLAVLVPHPAAWTIGSCIVSSISAIGLFLSLLMLTVSSFPRTKGPKDSMLYFGSIAAKELSSYKDDILKLSEKEYVNDLIGQIHRNAQIVDKKYYWIKRSLVALYISTLPWLVSIYLLYQL